MESDSDTADINDAEFDDRAADDPNLDEAADAESVEETDAPLDNEPRSIEEHVQEIVDAGSDRARLLGDDRGVLAEIDAVDAFDAIEDAETAPHTVVVDGLIDQRLLDVAAQRGVSELLGREVASSSSDLWERECSRSATSAPGADGGRGAPSARTIPVSQTTPTAQTRPTAPSTANSASPNVSETTSPIAIGTTNGIPGDTSTRSFRATTASPPRSVSASVPYAP